MLNQERKHDNKNSANLMDSIFEHLLYWLMNWIYSISLWDLPLTNFAFWNQNCLCVVNYKLDYILSTLWFKWTLCIYVTCKKTFLSNLKITIAWRMKSITHSSWAVQFGHISQVAIIPYVTYLFWKMELAIFSSSDLGNCIHTLQPETAWAQSWSCPKRKKCRLREITLILP